MSCKIGQCSLCYNDVIQCWFNTNNGIEVITFCSKCKNDAVKPLVVYFEDGKKIVAIKDSFHISHGQHNY